jgi:hypothetical protein
VKVFSPTIFDVARIERVLKSMNANLQIMAGIMLQNDDEIRIDRNDDEKTGHYEEDLDTEP